MTWKEIYNTGINEIDLQHQSICNTLEELNGSHGISPENVHSILFQLQEIVVVHFEFEESLMDDVKYPQIITHKKEHSDQVEKITTILNNFNVRRDYTVPGIYNTLKIWLIVHSLFEDRDFSNYYLKYKK